MKPQALIQLFGKLWSKFANLVIRLSELANKHPLFVKLSPFLLAGTTLLLVMLITLWPLWRSAELAEFDLLTVATAPRESVLPINIVGIDDSSMQYLVRQWPWPRCLHAKAIDHLVAQGARVIAFDVLFDQPEAREKSTPQPSDPQELQDILNECLAKYAHDDHPGDAALEAAIRRAGNVVLATYMTSQEGAYGRTWIENKPLPRFIQAGALSASINVDADADQVVRSQPASQNGMWREVLSILKKQEVGLNPDTFQSPNRRIRYLGPLNTFPYLPYTGAIAPNGFPTGSIDGAVILVGRTTLGAANLGGQTDTFPTPFSLVDHQLMPGVEIHATLIENAILRQTLREAPRWQAWLLAAVAALLLALASQRQRILWLPVTWIGIAALLIGGGWASFRYAGWWVPVAPALIAVTFAFLLRFFLVYITERRQRLAIRKMFTLYVPPKLVTQLEASPESLALGGSQRDVTIMFTDLAGFTTIAEAMPPQEVGKLLNAYFAAMTTIIFEYDGTLDKFIGDAIMAFWGAPIDDPQQAAHALACAVAMQQAAEKLNASFAEAGLPALSTRIGIHSGSANIGNFGSPERFSYTALGDVVNQAARMEGANKAYGTQILISEETADLAGGIVPLRRIDRVRVKGKTLPADFYTPCDDPQLVQMTDRAWQPYINGDWPAALALWQEIHAQWPKDPVAIAFIEKLSQPVPSNWDGAWTMESK